MLSCIVCTYIKIICYIYINAVYFGLNDEEFLSELCSEKHTAFASFHLDIKLQMLLRIKMLFPFV